MQIHTDHLTSAGPTKASTAALQVRQADERGDDAMRRAHAAEREAEQLREWGKLAFRALSHVKPALRHQECETEAERELVDRLCELAEDAAMQYLSVAGVRYEDAYADAREALKG